MGYRYVFARFHIVFWTFCQQNITRISISTKHHPYITIASLFLRQNLAHSPFKVILAEVVVVCICRMAHLDKLYLSNFHPQFWGFFISWKTFQASLHAYFSSFEPDIMGSQIGQRLNWNPLPDFSIRFQASLQYMGFCMVVVACRKIGLAFEFHFIIWRSCSNLKVKVQLKKYINRELLIL